MTTHLQLVTAVLQAHDDGQHVPCLGTDGKGDPRWLSDQRSDILDATTACRNCPVLTTCARYAKAERPTSGVWAGTARGKTGDATGPVRPGWGLTTTQKQLIDAELAAGRVSNKAIAATLGVREKQVAYYRSRKKTAA